MPGPGYKIAVHLHTRDERRHAERFEAHMPVSVDGHSGTTQDLSSSGLSFVADRAFDIGTRIEVVIEYLLDGHQYPLRCEAEVVRITPCAEGFVVGARLTPQSALEDVPVGVAASSGGGAGTGGQHLRRVL